jgi:hypothetical protein
MTSIQFASIAIYKFKTILEIWTKRDRRELYTTAECDFVIILI